TNGVQVDAPVEYVGKTATGAMAAPEGWWNVGWYRLGPAPGEMGNAVLAGHLDSESGPAVFWRLRELQVGDTVSVVDDRGNTIRFVVRRMQVYYNDNAPIREIFGAADGAYLNLITCDGYFDPDARIYDRRLVVFSERIN
ncbi:MAG: class F sortase, partial [Chloroflexota bacterium]|nr:class F sortase [Chloroflexota bacterium]